MQNEYKLRREKIGSLMDDKSILVLFANKSSEGNKEPNKNFLYSTNVSENEDILIIERNGDITKSILFIRPYDEFFAKWNGATLSKEEALSISQVDDVYYLNNFEMILRNYLNNGYSLYLDIENKPLESQIKNYLDLFVDNIKNKYPYANIKQGRTILQSVRTLKTPYEIAKIKEAIEITNKGILAILDNIKANIYEYQLESYFDQALKFNGSTSFAFDTIAAGGLNATCLHYSSNNSLLNEGDLILFDLGATKDYYCADISRTFPVSKRFTPRQKEIYNIVLNGQQKVFDSIKPGITTRELNQILIDYYKVELKRIGLIKEDSEVGKYYYHGVSHHLGLDCHDLCDYTPLKAGAVITVEPGLYISEEKIGIRIEDDVLVTETGYQNLSESIIKTVEDIENYLNK